MDEKATPTTDGERALAHAWQWFEYHANQRMAVFRFYILVLGALCAAYFTLLDKKYFGLAVVVAVFSAFVSYAFLRLDARGSELVKIAEAALKVEEARLASVLGYREIKLVEFADEKENKEETDEGEYDNSKIIVLNSFGTIFKALVTVTICLFTFGVFYGAYELLLAKPWFVNS